MSPYQLAEQMCMELGFEPYVVNMWFAAGQCYEIWLQGWKDKNQHLLSALEFRPTPANYLMAITERDGVKFKLILT